MNGLQEAHHRRWQDGSGIREQGHVFASQSDDGGERHLGFFILFYKMLIYLNRPIWMDGPDHLAGEALERLGRRQSRVR